MVNAEIFLRSRFWKSFSDTPAHNFRSSEPQWDLIPHNFMPKVDVEARNPNELVGKTNSSSLKIVFLGNLVLEKWLVSMYTN